VRGVLALAPGMIPGAYGAEEIHDFRRSGGSLHPLPFAGEPAAIDRLKTAW
jgi:hypothetical protein